MSSTALRSQALEWWLYENIKSGEADHPYWTYACFSYEEPPAAAGSVHWELPKREPFLSYERAHTHALNFTVHCFPRSGVCAVCTKAIYLFMACQWLYREINKAFKSKGDGAEEKVWHPRIHAAIYFLTLQDKQESKKFLTQDLPTDKCGKNGKPKGGNLKNSSKLLKNSSKLLRNSKIHVKISVQRWDGLHSSKRVWEMDMALNWAVG